MQTTTNEGERVNQALAAPANPGRVAGLRFNAEGDLVPVMRGQRHGIAGAFHKAGSSFGQAGAIVRMSAEHKITAVVSAWIRTRNGPADTLFITAPVSLAGAAEKLVVVAKLDGDDAKHRLDLYIEPHDVLQLWLTEGGYWGVLSMGRIGPSPKFRTELFKLDARWELVPETATTLAHVPDWLSEDFLECANGMPSAWAIMFAGATLFGGQDPKVMPEPPAVMPTSLAAAITSEERFRDGHRRLRTLTPEALNSYRAQLINDQQRQAFDDLLNGHRTHVGETAPS